MVCLAEDLVVWKDFPKGLRVLLLYEDGCNGVETRSKLESMDYIVSLYSNEDEALKAIATKANNFHVAILEVSTSTGSYERLLEVAQELPVIVVSDIQHLSIMMKCIALGAAEFLQKPISEDKLRNIWQHVVSKAFNAGGNDLSKSLKPVKETVISMLQLQPKIAEIKTERRSDSENQERGHKQGVEKTVAREKFVAPSTPQFDQGERLRPKDSQDVTNSSLEIERAEDIKGLGDDRKSTSCISKSVNSNYFNIASVSNVQEALPSKLGEAATEVEVNSANASNIDERGTAIEGSRSSSHSDNVNVEEQTKKNCIVNGLPCLNKKISKRKIKVDWTPELQKRFVQAVEQLGIDQAIPSKILELMKVEGLTRHNIASHLQKYRMNKRHFSPKSDDRRWQTQRNCMPKPILTYPPFHPNYNLAQNPVYPVWDHVSYQTHSFYMWPHTGFQTWHLSAEAYSWKDYSGMHADAWGCPIVPQYGHYHLHSPRVPMRTDLDVNEDRNKMWKISCDHLGQRESINRLCLEKRSKQQRTKPPCTGGLCNASDKCGRSNCAEAEEAIDKTVKEAMSKPRLPLPLGLKSPSTEAVLAELQRQGIRRVPLPTAAIPQGPHRHYQQPPIISP